MQLTADNVRKVFESCLFDPFSPHNVNDCSIVNVHGVKIKVNFDQFIISQWHVNIQEMLNQLPEPFFEGGTGGGHTFLYMNMNAKTGEQWADLHHSIDQLIYLGIAIGSVKFQLPRDMWGILPGGVPYISVTCR